MLQIVCTNITEFNHLEEYDENFYDSFTAHREGALNFKSGDRRLLLSLPLIADELHVVLGKKIKRLKVPEVSLKRKLGDVHDEEIEENIEPVAKKIHTCVDEVEATELLKNYVEGKVQGNHLYEVGIIVGKMSCKFICEFCQKKVSVGFKMSAKGKPTFIPTNILKHRCFKPQQQPMVANDSGLNES